MLPIYFINLASRPDRRAFMEAQFERLGLAATRIEAVATAEVTEDERAAYCDPRRAFCRSPSELACTKSHQRAWAALAAEGAPHGLILEDDAVLSNLLPGFIAGFDPAPYDLVRIETLERRIRLIAADAGRYGEVRLRRSVSSNNGSAGYIVSSAHAKRLLRHPKIFARPVDDLLFDPMLVRREGVRLVYTDPGLCIQLNNMRENRAAAGASDVSGPKPSASGLHRLQRGLRQAGYEIRAGIHHLRSLPQGVLRETIFFKA